MRKFALATMCTLAAAGCTSQSKPTYLVRLTLEAGEAREVATPGFAAVTAVRASREQVWRVSKG